MTIESNGAKVTVELAASGNRVRLVVEDANGDEFCSAHLDDNHCEALETALRAARLELHARAVST